MGHYICAICRRLYKTKGSLRSHTTRVHGSHDLRSEYGAVSPHCPRTEGDHGTTEQSFANTDDDGQSTGYSDPQLSTPANHFTMTNLCYDIYMYYDAFGDSTADIFGQCPALAPSLQSLSPECRLCVDYVCRSKLSRTACADYFRHIVERDNLTGAQSSSFLTTFPNARLLHRYCNTVCKRQVIADGWVRAVVQFAHVHNEPVWVLHLSPVPVMPCTS